MKTRKFLTFVDVLLGLLVALAFFSAVFFLFDRWMKG